MENGSPNPWVHSLRRTPRRTFAKPIGVLRQGAYLVLDALQLSEGGLLFSASEKFDNFETVVVSLLIHDTQSVVLTGSVIYTIKTENGFSVGVKFSEISVPQRRMIRQYVSAKTANEAKQEQDELVKALAENRRAG